jgi:predicted nucleotidyltransferase
LSSVVIKSVDAAAVRRAADEWAARLLVTRPDVEKIVVFGSFAKDTYAPGSDLDVFILLSGSNKPFRERIPDFLPDTFPVGMDLFPYTQEEVSARALAPFLTEVRASNWRYGR